MATQEGVEGEGGVDLNLDAVALDRTPSRDGNRARAMRAPPNAMLPATRQPASEAMEEGG